MNSNRSHDHHLHLPRSFQLLLFLILLSTGFISFSRRSFDQMVQVEHLSRAHCMIIDGTGSITSAILLSFVAYFSYYYPFWRRPRVLTFAIYIIMMSIHSVLFAYTSMTLRDIGFQLFNLSSTQQTGLLQVILDELPAQIFMFIVTSATMHGVYFFQYSTAEKIRLNLVEKKLAQERLRSLQNQLNPHFLFNTLNMISGMMYQNVETADRMIERLSELLRASLMFGFRADTEVTIEEELKLLSAYTSIMQERFPGLFEVQIDCPEDLYQIRIPPLLLQPLIENSIKHGYFDVRDSLLENGLIQVMIKIEENTLKISVIDNGIREVSAHKIQLNPSTIQPFHQSLDQEGSGVGLKLTYDRLQLIYGERAQLDAGPRKTGVGYQVNIELPFFSQKQNRSSNNLVTNSPNSLIIG